MHSFVKVAHISKAKTGNLAKRHRDTPTCVVHLKQVSDLVGRDNNNAKV